MLPGMLKAVLDSTDMLTNFLPIFSANLIDGLTANQAKLRENIENSPVIVTLLTPKIGYLKSADLFKESLKTGKTIRNRRMRVCYVVSRTGGNAEDIGQRMCNKRVEMDSRNKMCGRGGCALGRAL